MSWVTEAGWVKSISLKFDDESSFPVVFKKAVTLSAILVQFMMKADSDEWLQWHDGDALILTESDWCCEGPFCILSSFPDGTTIVGHVDAEANGSSTCIATYLEKRWIVVMFSSSHESFPLKHRKHVLRLPMFGYSEDYKFSYDVYRKWLDKVYLDVIPALRSIPKDETVCGMKSGRPQGELNLFEKVHGFDYHRISISSDPVPGDDAIIAPLPEPRDKRRNRGER